MKKNLALILALVMIIGSLLAVVPMAEEGVEEPVAAPTAGKAGPDIKYSNINYADKIYMMFAVPVTTLEEGEELKLLVWESRDDSFIFSYNDVAKEVISAEAAPATINGESYLVFKYDKLSAADMANNICARTVIVKADAPVAYGSVIEYSILEYITAAKGGFDGIAGLTDASKIELLDSMLTFGALAQKYLLEKEPEYYVNETLNKVFVTPVVNGVAQPKTFSGFYKYEEGGEVTLNFPYFDVTQVVRVLDAQGNEVVDIDESVAGIQVASSATDIELTVEYQNTALTTLVAENYGADFNFNTVDGYTGTSTEFNKASGTGNGDKALYNGDMTLNKIKQITWNNSSASFTHGSEKTDGSSKNYRRYHGFKAVADPENEGQLVFQWTASDYGGFTHSQFSEQNLKAAGVGDMVGTVITFSMDLGGHNGKVANIGSLYHRLRVTKYYDNNADGTPKLDESGAAQTSTTRIDIDTHICRVNGGYFQIATTPTSGTTPAYINVAEVPVNGMKKFAVSVDYDAEMIYAYVEDDNGVMQLTKSAPIFCAKYAANAGKLGFDGMKSLVLPSTAEGVIAAQSGWTFTGSSNWGSGDSALVDLDGDGNATDKVLEGYVPNDNSYWALVNDKLVQFKNNNGPKMSPNYNLKAVQMYAEANCGILIDNYYLMVGNPYI